MKVSSLRPAVIVIGLGFLATSAAPAAATIEEVVRLPVTITDAQGKARTLSLTLTIFRDDQRPRSPFLVLNHGRPSESVDLAKLGRVRYSDNSEYFVSRGFAVFVPTRAGYGETGGEDVESTSACSKANFRRGFEASSQQTIAIIDYARARQYVDASRGLVVGQSWGGATAIAVAAKNVPGVLAAVNFAGGGGGHPIRRPESPCGKEQLSELFAYYGTTARIPTLWAYSGNDRFFGKEAPRAWFEAFRARGGAGEFLQLPPHGEDGHTSFVRNPGAWRPAFEDFLRTTGFWEAREQIGEPL